MKGTVHRIELFDFEDDAQDGPRRKHLGWVYRVTCNTHGESHDCDHRRQADTLARSSPSFCHACADAIRESVVVDSELAKELRDERRAEDRLRDIERTS